MLAIALALISIFSEKCDDAIKPPWDYHKYFRFTSTNSITSKTNENEREKKISNFLIAIDYCRMADWIAEHQSEDNYIEWLPIDVICKRWHIFHDKAISNTNLWKGCILKNHRCEILEYARSDCELSKDTALLYQLQDLRLISNIKANLKRNCNAGYIDMQDRIAASDYVKLIMQYSDSSDKIKILSIMSLSKKVERARYSDFPLGGHFALTLARFLKDKEATQAIINCGYLNPKFRRDLNKRDSCDSVIHDYCVKYAISKSGLTENELLNYLVKENTFIPTAKDELQFNAIWKEKDRRPSDAIAPKIP